MTAWIEPAIPFPRISIKGVADAPRDRPGLNIAVKDVPAVGPLRIPASGEGGHAPMKAPTERVSKSSYSLGLKQGGLEGERQQQEYPNQDNRCYDNDSKEKSGHSRPTPERLICSIRPT